MCNKVELTFSSTPTPSFTRVLKGSGGKVESTTALFPIITAERLTALMSHKSPLHSAHTHAYFN